MTRNRKQHGSVVRISGNWYVRYWQRQNVNGECQRKRVSHCIGPVTTRGKHPPADVLKAIEQHMATVNDGPIAPERIVTVGDFVSAAFFPWMETNLRPSTRHGYTSIWRQHLKPLCEAEMLKDVRTFHAQQWLTVIGSGTLSRSMLRLAKSLGRSIFRVAKQQGYYDRADNPFAETSLSHNAPEPRQTHAYTLAEIRTMLEVVPEPAATAIATAAFAGLGEAELQGLEWENYRDGHLFVERNNWNGHITPPKTEARRAAVPVIRLLAERLEMHRLHTGNPVTGPIFRLVRTRRCTCPILLIG